MTTLLWAIGPAVVGLVALVSGAVWPVLVIAAVALAGAFAASALHDPGPAPADGSGHPRVWRLGWPALCQEGAVMMCVGAAYTGLPVLLETVGSAAGAAGSVLAVFAMAGLAGGLVYGSRRWPGAYRDQSTVLVLAVTVLVGAAVVMPVAAFVIGLLVLSGVAGTPALTARAAGMRELLPERVWATGFSWLYAAGGVGFGLAAAATVVGGVAEARAARKGEVSLT